MMAEKLVNNQICENCEAEVRQNALFCYNCGFQVAESEEIETTESNGNRVSNAWFRDSITEVKATETITEVPKIAPQKTEPRIKFNDTEPAIKPKKAEVSTEVKTKFDSTKVPTKTKPADLSKLKTAASLRQKSRLTPKKTVEVVWEPPKSTPNVWFLLVSLFLAGLAIAALFAMLYIR